MLRLIVLRKLRLTVGVLGLLLVSAAPFAAAGAFPAPGRRDETVTPPAPAAYGALDVAVPRQARSASALAALVDRVDGARWHADVVKLAQVGAAEGEVWGTRHTFTAANLAARDWVAAELQDLGWDTYLDDFFITGGPISYNVVAERAGASRPDDIYIVGAHMDSTSQQWLTRAPGAEDNASGTAGLLEIARALDGYTPAATIRIVAFSGEEQGLVGSEAYVEYLEDVAHELDRVKAVYNLDMIGYTTDDAELHVLLQSYNPAQFPWMGDLRAHLAGMAASYTALDVYTSNYSLGSDHLPFLWRGIPAVLMIANEYNAYPYYHNVNDLPEYVVPQEGEAILRMVLASLAAKSGVICIYADVNCDGSVNPDDLAAMEPVWSLNAADPGFDAASDIDVDGLISVADFELAALARFPD